MLKKQLYNVLFLSVLLLTACDAWIYEYPEAQAETGNAEPLVYLSIAKVAHADGLESINVDAVDFEDRVHDLALFIFDTSTGDLVTTYFDENIPIDNKISRFTVALTPGQRDFYFIANMPMTALKSISSKADLVDYLDLLRNLDTDLYLGAQNNKGFPMSRVYANQTINRGGNAYTPEPFMPVVNGTPETKVKLIRVTAKLEVKFSGSASIGVKKIYFKNANRKFSLVTQSTSPDTFYTDVEEMKKSGDSYLYYMPEALMEDVDWDDATPAPINYFLIETIEGKLFQIPVISHNDPVSSSQYLSLATGKELTQPDYSVYRNRHYLFTISNLQQLEINYQIDPWNKVSFTTFMGYGYNIKIDDNGQVTIENTVEACDPHEIKLETKGSFQFDDSDTEKLFTDSNPNATATYVITPVPEEADGDYLEVYYNDVLVKTFSK